MSQDMGRFADDIFNVSDCFIALKFKVVETLSDSGAAMSSSVISLDMKAIFYWGQNMWREIFRRAQSTMQQEQWWSFLWILNAPREMTAKIDVSHGLEGIHNVAISTIKGEVVPAPIGDGADAIASTHEIEEVQEEPSEPSDWSADL